MKCLPGNLGKCLNQPPRGPSALASSSASANQPLHPGIQQASASQVSNSPPFLPKTHSVPVLSSIQQSSSQHLSMPASRHAGLPEVSPFSASQPADPSQASQASLSSASQPTPPDQLVSSLLPLTFPSWNTIFSHPTSTLHHIPKGARDVWAELVHDVFTAVNRDPTSPDPWLKCFLLPRCVVANPHNGGCLYWRMIRKTIKAYIGRWQTGYVLDLWTDFLISVEKSYRHRRGKKNASQQESVWAASIRQAKQAVEVGQYRKGIQALTSKGLAPPSADILAEMLAKNPQTLLPPSPPHPAPLPANIMEEAVVNAVCSFPGDSAPGPSLLRANHLKETILCPSPDCGNKALQAITGTVNHLCAGRIHPDIIPISVERPYLPATRREVDTIQLPLERSSGT